MVSFRRWKNEKEAPTEPGIMEHGYGKEADSKEGSDDLNVHTVPAHKDGELTRALKARHVSMIAIGGALGTGLIIGTGKALAQAGPGSVFIAYCLVGLNVYVVMTALGEMAAWLPQPSGFSGYALRFVDPALGFAVGWTYWFKYIIITPNQLTAASIILQEWVPRERLNPGVWIAVFLVIICAINYWGVALFGEFEFWLSSLKVVIICGLIIFSAVIAAGGGPKPATGFKYWNDPGAFKPMDYVWPESTAKFVAFWSTMVNATFAYLGTELIGVTVGEAQNPRRSIPRAIKLTFFRILFFYCLSTLLLGMIVPYNSPKLSFAASKAKTGSNASPFVVAITEAGIPTLPGIINGCILVFVFSASNSDLYIASRTIYGLAREHKAPRFFAITDKRGVPIFSLFVSALFGCLAFMNVSDDSKTVFDYFVNLTTVFGLLTWLSILFTHTRFVRARRVQGITDDQLVYKAPLGLWGTWVAFGFTGLITLFKSFTAFLWTPKGNFDYKSFITGYIGIPLFIILFFGWKFAKRTQWIPLAECDFYEGKKEIDDEEAEFVARKEAKLRQQKAKGGFKWVYKRFISWLF